MTYLDDLYDFAVDAAVYSESGSAVRNSVEALAGKVLRDVIERPKKCRCGPCNRIVEHVERFAKQRGIDLKEPE